MGWRGTKRNVWGDCFKRWLEVVACVFALVGMGWAEEVVLVYTGNTQSFLEVCGCSDNQLGGVARRATIVNDLKRAHPNALVLDAGGLFAGDTVLDQLRCRVHLDAMQAMGYDVANVGVGELRFGLAFFETMRDSGGVDFVSANLVLNGQGLLVRSRILEVGGVRVGVVGVAGDAVVEGHKMTMVSRLDLPDGVAVAMEGIDEVVREVNREVDLVVVLSDLDGDDEREILGKIAGVDVIIRARQVLDGLLNHDALVLDTHPQGKAVGLAILKVEKGEIASEQVKTVFVSESLAEDKAVKALVDGFYDQVQNNADLQQVGKPRFDGFALEEQVNVGLNGYVGIDACGGCHIEEVTDWEHSHHANAFDRLLQVQKQYQPDCVTCHTVGFGYPTGFQIAKDAKYLTNVQCEVCHGPGGQHVRRPEVRNIRRTPSKDFCQRCHNADQTPDFDARFAQMWEEVNHSGHYEAKDVEPDVVSNIGQGGRPLVELFVMADCPYGIRAEEALAPVFRQLGDQIDFRLHFIADEAGVERSAAEVTHTRSGPGCEATTTSGTGRFRSLHGDPEVAEGIRQTVVMALYPDRFWDYILCRNESGIETDWRVCAEKVGMDVAQIAEQAKGQVGETLFAENIRRANMLGINASPTLLVNGQEVEAFFDAGAVARLICRDGDAVDLCDALPECQTDQDCAQAGKVGVCVAGGTGQARCEIHDPVAFEVTVLNDSNCAVCETYPFIRSTLALFPGAQFRTVDVKSELGKEMTERYGVDRVPAFVLDGNFAKTARFDRFAHIVKQVGDDFIPDARLTPVSLVVKGQDLEGIDLFLDIDAPTSLGMAERLLRWVGEVNAPERLRLHFVGDSEKNALFRRVQQAAPNQVADLVMCHIQGLYSGQFSTADCLKQAGVDLATVDNKADVLARANLLGVTPQMAPAVVIDGQFVVQAGGLAQVEALFYRLHPQLAHRDRNSATRTGVK